MKFDKKYFKMMCETFYEEHIGGVSFRVQKTSDYDIETLRLYAEGRQDVRPYIQNLVGTNKENKIRKIGINTRIPNPLEKQIKLLVELLAESKPDIQPSANDYASLFEKEVQKNKKKLAVDPRVGKIVQQMGLPQEMPEGIETPEDIDLLDQYGGEKLIDEIIAKDLTDIPLKSSATRAIYQMVDEDFIKLNCGGVEVVTTNNGIELKYIDPANYIARNTIYPDGRDQDYRGYMEYMQGSYLIHQVDKEDIPALLAVCDVEPRDYLHIDRNTRAGLNILGRAIDKATKKVVTMYWKESVTEFYLTGRHPKYGSRIFTKVDANTKLSERHIKQGKRIEEIPTHKMYRAQWIVGTDIVFNAGEFTDCAYEGADGEKTPLFPIVFYHGQQPSMVEQCIPDIDDVALNVLKIRQLIKNTPPAPRIAIDKSLVQPTVTYGNHTYSLEETIEVYASRGIFVFESLPYDAAPGENLNNYRNALTFLPSGVREDIATSLQMIANAMQNIRTITAVNEVFDGTQTSPELGKAVMEQHVQTAVNANKQLVRATIALFEDIAKVILLTHASKPLSKAYREKLGLSDEKADEFFNNIRKRTWRLKMTAAGQKDKARLSKLLEMYTPMLSPNAILLVERCLTDGDYMKASIILTREYEKGRKQKMEEASAPAIAQANAQERLKQQEMQAEQMRIQAETEAKMRINEQLHAHRLAEIREKAALMPNKDLSFPTL